MSENTGAIVNVGPFSLPQDEIATLAVASYAKTGVVLANERITAVIPTPTTLPSGEVVMLPCKYTLSTYIQREALTPEESVEVAKVKTERDAKTAQRKAEDEAKLDKVAKLNYDLGQQGIMTAMRNLGELQRAAAAIAQATK